MADVRMPLDSGDFGLLDRVVVEQFRRMPEHNPFLRGMRSWVGFCQSAFEYERAARAGGEPKYTLGKLWHLALDGLAGFSAAPLKLATRAGVGFVFAALAMLVVWLGAGILGRGLSGSLAVVGVVLLAAGVQLICLGFTGEYIRRILDEVRARPLYVVRERHISAQVLPERPTMAAATRFAPDPSVPNARTPGRDLRTEVLV
jgi:dolichol-phosphate mannosyltransferase